MNLEIGMYCYDKTNRKLGIGKIVSYEKNGNYNILFKDKVKRINYGNLVASFDIKDLIVYMDLLIINKPIKLYDIDKVVKLCNPIRCDGFTKFNDGTHCIILDLDCIVDLKDLKIDGILTYEQFENNYLKIGG